MTKEQPEKNSGSRIHRMQIWRTTRMARDELHEIEATAASLCFVLTVRLEKCFVVLSLSICSVLFRLYFTMPTSCSVPECHQKGPKSTTGEKVSFFDFPSSPLRRKQWIHAIRRDEGKDFTIRKGTKVCSLHFRREDVRKSFNGRAYVVPGGVPTRFAWSVPSPRKRKAPPERHPLPQKKKLFSSASTRTESQETNTAVERVCESTSSVLIDELSQNDEINESNLEPDAVDYRKKVMEEMEQELINLRQENIELKNKLAEGERQHEAISSRLFCLERFSSDADINFYIGLPNFATFMAIFNFLNPGEDGENIRPRSTLTDVPEGFYDTDSDEDENVTPAKKGRRRKLQPIEEFFIVLCRLRRGFSERHLAHLYGVAQSTISRIFVPWINFMFLKFGQVCIWPSKSIVQETMPADFKEKFSSTRVIIDCTEVFIEMPSSLLLNSELFSSYKSHVTLKALVGIAPSGAITFISQLYTGSISDREIVLRSGLLSQSFDDGDSVMADKGFQIQDILPLGVSLNIPPFLGSNPQMSAEDVIRTQQIASLRIHVERAINKTKNFRIWNGVVP